MQTHFTSEQLQNPLIAEADSILRKCVHCGFCTATCPTFVLTGDERDSPRGRIWMIRDMLENEADAPPSDTGFHLDRCLTCLSCTTTCPSGVDYMHLVDIGRQHHENQTRRVWHDTVLRYMLGRIVPRAGLFHYALAFARLARPLAQPLRRLFGPKIGAMLALAPQRWRALDPVGATDARYRPKELAAKRVALLAGCAQRAINPDINAATIALLNRFGVEVVVKKQAYCCGALSHHINDEKGAKAAMRSAVAAWADELHGEGLDAVIVNTSGCGTTIKDYVNLLKDDADYATLAEQISAMSRDITEFLHEANILPPLSPRDMRIGYHAACSLQHGQKIVSAPKDLLARAGFEVLTAKESHLCCGSAGVYNILQAELAEQLQKRKLGHINDLQADIVVAGNLGCINQLSDSNAPIMHIIELLDWAYGGDKPRDLPNKFAK